MQTEEAITWLNRFANRVIDNKVYLSDLDQAIGDGDHGVNMARGTAAMKDAINGKTFDSVQEVFKAAAMALLSKVGGASGPLYGSAFLAMAKAPADADLCTLITAGAEGIQKRGKALPGDKTMVDVWVPAAGALKNGTLNAEAVQQFVEATKALQAKKGRASYLGERSVGHVDPGSASSGYLLDALLEVGEADG